MDNNEILRDLIQINNDRIAGYRKAIDELTASDSDLKSLFSEMAEESEHFVGELKKAVGGETTTDTTTSGKLYRAWMDLKATIAGTDRRTILENCEFGEDAAQKAYNSALADNDLSIHCKNMILVQQVALKASHDKIKALRNNEREKS